ncbi:uncharacterized protein CANTADRAFT_3747 [Suhomyces tanzawaensis NRRL Y-17324]|uniref:Rpr2-domain-containing protein n=1 Tax=Suhomyces tanzawaensis NRRL Y-17324 TaxID=984487 RepID=A0A1E4SQ73_9ASCO|nr:uncharacterized protein CANTADRAFT_3747 [Suhomyces tanzawaensis NRRL Y-17324]ODV81663.1 hypothetical protein CANTADRAFT_3747 [Suhomyces tanzawaensis NRRL Y-17324]
MLDLHPSQITSLHRYNLVHAVPLGPLNQHYSSKLVQHNAENVINLPPVLSHKFCKNCGVLWIPGITVSIRIIYRHKSKARKNIVGKKTSASSNKFLPGRRLQHKCLQCKYKDFDTSLIQSNAKSVDLDVDENKVGEAGPKKENSKSRERTKKRKKNTLGSLLEEKKKQQAAAKGGLNSLNLMEFMK